MASRYEITTGNIQKKEIKVKAAAARHKPLLPSFTTNLNLVNKINQTEISLKDADFSLNIFSTAHEGNTASISISFNIPVEEARKFFQEV